MPAKSVQISPPDPHQLFLAARLVQTAKNAHVTCRFWRCTTRGLCTGGPRGTCRATGGFPLCSSEGERRLDMYKSRRQWQPEKGHENDSEAERQTRYMQLISKRFDLEALIAETKKTSLLIKGQ